MIALMTSSLPRPSHNTARSYHCCNKVLYCSGWFLHGVTIPLAVIAVATECKRINWKDRKGHNTACGNHCCNSLRWRQKSPVISHNTACGNHCCNLLWSLKEEMYYVTIPLAVITVATAPLENPCPERLSKPDLANQMNFYWDFRKNSSFLHSFCFPDLWIQVTARLSRFGKPL